MRKISTILITALAVLYPVKVVFCQTISERMAAASYDVNLSDGDDLGFSIFDQNSKNNPNAKSKWKALGLSMLLPGAGQYYAGSTRKMTIFGVAEAGVWGGFCGLRVYGSWKKEDYRGWAALKAGADVNGKSESFFEKLTYYDNRDEYNQLELLYEGSRAELVPTTPDYYWNWDSDVSRNHFRDLRNQSKTAYRRSLLFLGAAVINRILAGIDAYRTASSYNRRSEFGDTGWNLYYASDGIWEDGRVVVGISKRF